MPRSFFQPYRHGFVRAAVCIPRVHLADPAANAEGTLALLQEAARRQARLAVFPELGLTGYSCEDLFHQQALLDSAVAALGRVLEGSRGLPLLAVVGLPLAVEGRLFNCAAVLRDGALLGLVPKSYLPGYREFYEVRQFAPAERAPRTEVELCGQRVPFGPELLFVAEERPEWVLHVEICEDLWVPVPPSTYAALAGATVLANLSASNATVAKDDYRRLLVASQSGRCVAAYLYAAADGGESTTDLAWDGHGMIYENGGLLAETERFTRHPRMAVADLDLDRLQQDRLRQNSFQESARHHGPRLAAFRRIPFRLEPPAEGPLALARPVERYPFVPADPARRDERCAEVYAIQAEGLARRLEAAGVQRMVIGVSGGLDSTQALLVCARACDLLGWPRERILAYTLPGFGTTERTLGQARRLMAVLGVQSGEIDIRPGCLQVLRDIGHPFAEGRPVHDVTFENVQAGQRAQLLFRLANRHGGLVVGTSDLSELALGWCTYGVGDHMAHYHVNASVPKTLIQHLIRWVARRGELGPEASRVLEEVLATEISPELLPGEAGGQPVQRTEEVVGPYALQDFHLYYLLRFGYRPPKVAYLAWCAWHDPDRGPWPEVPPRKRRAYAIAEIKHWLRVFLERFFAASQYKRSCLPNAPKVGSGGSLSPRGDWRAPSDACAGPWLASLAEIPERDP